MRYEHSENTGCHDHHSDPFNIHVHKYFTNIALRRDLERFWKNEVENILSVKKNDSFSCASGTWETKQAPTAKPWTPILVKVHGKGTESAETFKHEMSANQPVFTVRALSPLTG